MKFMFKGILSLGLLMATQVASANVVGSAYQIFNPTYNGSGFVTVESSQTLKSGQFSLGIMFDYGSNSLPYITTESVDGSLTEDRKDSLTTGTFTLGLGITEGWDVGITVPVAFNQVVENGRIVENDLSDNNVTEIRFATKVRLVGNDKSAVALIGRLNLDRIDDNVFTGKDPDIGYSFELAWSSQLSDKVDVAFNAGYKWNGTGDDIAGQQYQIQDDMILTSAAVGFAANDEWKLSAELYRGQASNDVAHPTDRKQDPFEGLVGLRWSPSRLMAWQVGYAREIQHSLGSADWRAFAGVNLTFGGTPPPMEVIIPKPMPLPMPEPTPVAAPLPEPEQKITIKNITFASGSAVLSNDKGTSDALNDLVKTLKEGFTALEVAGHSDSLGSDETNLKISQKRAEAIKDRLVKLGGFNASSITAKGYGESQPIDSNTTAEGRANNRRVEFSITK